MYKPNPFRLSTLHTWIDQALEDHKDDKGVDAKTVMKHIHKHHPGVLFSPHWFAVQYRRHVNNKNKDKYIRIAV